MRIETLAVRLRPRTPLEAADLGVRLCQSTAWPVYACYAMVAVPTIGLALVSYEIAGWLPGIAIWCAKPWLDRTILFVLSRAAFGQPTTPGDVWRAQWQVWWRQFFFTWTIRRFSLWRSLTEPVYLLEDLSVWEAGSRVTRIRQRHAAAAMMMTTAFSFAENGLLLAVMSMLFWLAPKGMTPDLVRLFTGPGNDFLALAFPVSYALVVFFLEPFYVAAGFGMYLNRRAELEAWDIEQEFRRAFAA